MGCSSSKEAEKDAALSAPAVPRARNEPQQTRFAKVYKAGPKLGSGGFATVRLATHIESGKEYAVKIMPLPRPNEAPTDTGATREEIFNEVNILSKLENPNCLLYKEWFAESDNALIVSEYVQGGEVLEALTKKGNYDEDDARVVIKQLLSGLTYLHALDIMHRDLKLENLMLSKPGNITAGVKIVDFGLARISAPFDENDVCGTPMYVAPEVLGTPGPKGKRGAAAVTVAVDMWAAGVILYMLLAGFAPFSAEPDAALFSLIRKGGYSFGDAVWSAVSQEAKDLIQALLVVNPDARFTAGAALRHSWFGAAFEGPHPLSAAQAGLCKIMAKRRFKGAVGSVVAVSRMKQRLELLEARKGESS